VDNVFFRKLLQLGEKKGLANATKGYKKQVHKIHDILKEKIQKSLDLDNVIRIR
jgi:hypothetical protein